MTDQAKRTIIKKFIGEISLHNNTLKLYEIVKSIEKIDPNTKDVLSKLITKKFNNLKCIDIDIVKEIRLSIWDKN